MFHNQQLRPLSEARLTEIRTDLAKPYRDNPYVGSYDAAADALEEVLSEAAYQRARAEAAEARLVAMGAELTEARQEGEEIRGILGNGFRGNTLLIWCLRYGSDDDLDYVFDKLSRRCSAGKAMTQALQTERDKVATLKADMVTQLRLLKASIPDVSDPLLPHILDVDLPAHVDHVVDTLGLNIS